MSDIQKSNSLEGRFGEVIFVISGKGGVGKSTVAANLALGLKEKGHTVGMLDADLHGPSQSVMFNLFSPPQVEDGKMIPPEQYGVKVMSAGMFGDKAKPFVWKGPLLKGVLRQMLKDTEWNKPDYLIVDLPPGTGDTLTILLDYLKPKGAVVVTTPQSVASADTRRLMTMFSTLKLPVLAVVENMSNYECPHCHVPSKIFAGGGGGKLSREFNVQNLIEVPISSSLSLSGDNGKPLLAAPPADESQKHVVESLHKLVDKISMRVG